MISRARQQTSRNLVHDWHNTKEINGKQVDYWAKLGGAWLHGCNMNRTQQNLAALNYMSSRTQQNSAVRWTELSGTWHDLTTWLAEMWTNLQKNIGKTAENMWIIGKTRQGIITWLQDERNSTELSNTQLITCLAELSRTQLQGEQNSAELGKTLLHD